MNVFTDILTLVNNNNPKNFLFTNHFNHNILSHNNITYADFTNYKYFILKNFLFSSNIDDSLINSTLDIFSKAQKLYLALCKFKSIIAFKNKKQVDEHIDLQFNNVDLLDKKYIITLINSNIK